MLVRGFGGKMIGFVLAALAAQLVFNGLSHVDPNLADYRWLTIGLSPES
jgi:hypothetical protein